MVEFIEKCAVNSYFSKRFKFFQCYLYIRFRNNISRAFFGFDFFFTYWRPCSFFVCNASATFDNNTIRNMLMKKLDKYPNRLMGINRKIIVFRENWLLKEWLLIKPFDKPYINKQNDKLLLLFFGFSFSQSSVGFSHYACQ